MAKANVATWMGDGAFTHRSQFGTANSNLARVKRTDSVHAVGTPEFFALMFSYSMDVAAKVLCHFAGDGYHPDDPKSMLEGLDGVNLFQANYCRLLATTGQVTI